jgi:hypothetical protein
MIQAHIRLTQNLNPGKEHLYKWLIIENTPENLKDLKPYDIDSRIEYEMVEGCEKIEEASHLVSWGSISHAMSLNKVIDRIDSEYLLVVDHDCLIVEENWIDKTISHMNASNLSFFGVPYFPSNYKSYRYFPCAICMFIDMRKVRKSSLDFMPQDHIYTKAHLIASYGFIKSTIILLIRLLVILYRSFLRFIKPNHKVNNIGVSDLKAFYFRSQYNTLMKSLSPSFIKPLKSLLNIVDNSIKILKKKLEIFRTYYAVSKTVRTLTDKEILTLSDKGIHLNSKGSLIKQTFREWIHNLMPYLAVGACKDTGWLIFQRFNKICSSECLIPVWDKLNRRDFKFIHDEYNLVPQREGYFLKNLQNLKDPTNQLIPEDWEKYLWQGKIFCFHASSVGHRPVEERKKRVIIIVSIVEKIATSNEPISHSSQTRDQ